MWQKNNKQFWKNMRYFNIKILVSTYDHEGRLDMTTPEEPTKDFHLKENEKINGIQYSKDNEGKYIWTLGCNETLPNEILKAIPLAVLKKMEGYTNTIKFKALKAKGSPENADERASSMSLFTAMYGTTASEERAPTTPTTPWD